MFCPHCGKELADDASFCGGCGKPMQNTASIAPKRKRSTKIIAALIVSLLVLAAVGAITVVNLLANRALSQDDILSAIQNETELCEPIEGLSGIEDPEYSIASFEITSRKTNTDNGSDDVQCKIILDNGIVRINRAVQLYFGKYDQGWTLDNATEIECSFEPLAAPITGLEDVAISIEFDPESNSCLIYEPFESDEWYGHVSGSAAHFWSFDTEMSGWYEQDYWTETDIDTQVIGRYEAEPFDDRDQSSLQRGTYQFESYSISLDKISYDNRSIDLTWYKRYNVVYDNDARNESDNSYERSMKFVDNWEEPEDPEDDSYYYIELTDVGFDVYIYPDNPWLKLSAEAIFDDAGNVDHFDVYDDSFNSVYSVSLYKAA